MAQRTRGFIVVLDDGGVEAEEGGAGPAGVGDVARNDRAGSRDRAVGRSWGRVRAPMDALLAAQVQSFGGPKRLNSAHCRVVASLTRPRVCGELVGFPWCTGSSGKQKPMFKAA